MALGDVSQMVIGGGGIRRPRSRIRFVLALLVTCLTPLLASAEVAELLSKAGALRKAGALAEARELYAEAHRASPAQPEPVFLLGMTSRGQGRVAEATSCATAFSNCWIV